MTDVVSIKLDRTEIVCVVEMLAKRNQIPFDGILYAAVASMHSGNPISIYPNTDIAGTHRRLGDLMEDYRGHFDEEKNCWMQWTPNGNVECDPPTKYPTPDEVNEWAKKGFGHDAINRWICVEARAKNLGVYGKCEHCGGKGYIFDEDEVTLSLQLWVLHPRKGCSRGVLIKNIRESDMPAVYELLRTAAERNANRFAKIPTK
jgi:hypothetical protein